MCSKKNCTKTHIYHKFSPELSIIHTDRMVKLSKKGRNWEEIIKIK